MRRRTLLVALAGLAVVGAVGAVVLWLPEDRITESNVDRVRRGMSQAEVKVILGPPGDYTSGPVSPLDGATPIGFSEAADPSVGRRWVS
jgi:hypothetical protein